MSKTVTLTAAATALSLISYHFLGRNSSSSTNSKNSSVAPHNDKYYCLITGCSRGIGYNLVKEIVTTSDNYFIFATCRTPSKAKQLQDLASKYPSKINILQLDVSDQNSIKQAFTQISLYLNTNNNGILDILINNAAMCTSNHPWEYVTDTDNKGVSRDAATKSNMMDLYETNVVGPLQMMQQFIPIMEANSRVINVSSSLGSISNVYNNISSFGSHVVSYRCSKAGLNMLNNIFAGSEGINKKIIFMILHPSWCDTDMGTSYGKRNPPIKVKNAVKGIIKVIESMKFDTHNGKFYAWNGEQVKW